MIKLTDAVQQDFLNRVWVEKLISAGVDMSDAKYCIFKRFGIDYVDLKENNIGNSMVPTYTVSELFYKLHEWITPTINNVKYYGGLRMYKDAPFYPAYYRLENTDNSDWDESYYAAYEHPIESLASLLIQCHQKGTGYQNNDVGNINDKK